MTAPTPVERFILSNQCRILEKLYPEEADDLGILREALERGFEVVYMDYIDEFGLLTALECNEVYETLTMYQHIKQAAENLNETKWLEEQYDGTFQGYDGNNETIFMGFVRFIIERRKQYSDVFPNIEYNSHTPMRHRYQEMVERWRGVINSKKIGDRLSKNDIKLILGLSN